MFTRKNGKPARDFRTTWETLVFALELAKSSVLVALARESQARKCEKCGAQHSEYTGLIFDDLRRTAARNLRRAGIAEGVIMNIGGWKTRSVFERYAIVSRTDIVDAMQKHQQAERAIETAASVTWSRNWYAA